MSMLQMSWINNLSFQFKKLEKEESKPKANRRKSNINRAELNEACACMISFICHSQKATPL